MYTGSKSLQYLSIPVYAFPPRSVDCSLTRRVLCSYTIFKNLTSAPASYLCVLPTLIPPSCSHPHRLRRGLVVRRRRDASGVDRLLPHGAASSFGRVGGKLTPCQQVCSSLIAASSNISAFFSPAEALPELGRIGNDTNVGYVWVLINCLASAGYVSIA